MFLFVFETIQLQFDPLRSLMGKGKQDKYTTIPRSKYISATYFGVGMENE